MVATHDSIDLEELAGESWSALDRLARALYLETADLQGTLSAIVELAVQTIPVARYAGLIRMVHRKLVPQATVGEPPRVLDLLQKELESGPCIDAALTQSIITVDDTTTTTYYADTTADHAVGDLQTVKPPRVPAT